MKQQKSGGRVAVVTRARRCRSGTEIRAATKNLYDAIRIRKTHWPGQDAHTDNHLVEGAGFVGGTKPAPPGENGTHKQLSPRENMKCTRAGGHAGERAISPRSP